MTPQKTGPFIASLRKEKGWTQQVLADKLQVSVKAVSRWETGKGYPDVTILPLLANELNISIGELLNGERDAVIPVSSHDTTLLNMYADTRRYDRKNRALKIGIGISAATALLTMAICILTIVVGVLGGFQISQTFKGRSYCVLADDLSYMTYYGERYVPLDTGGYECRIGEEIVDEVRLESGDIFSKFFSEYNVHSINGVPDFEMIYLQSEHDICYYVKESCKSSYEQQLNAFEPFALYALIVQPDFYEKTCLLDENIVNVLSTLTQYDRDSSLTCAYTAQQPRLTVIVYDCEGIFYKEIGDIFKENDTYYWYDYAGETFPAASAHTTIPYQLDASCYDALDTLFSYTF